MVVRTPSADRQPPPAPHAGSHPAHAHAHRPRGAKRTWTGPIAAQISAQQGPFSGHFAWFFHADRRTPTHTICADPSRPGPVPTPRKVPRNKALFQVISPGFSTQTGARPASRTGYVGFCRNTNTANRAGLMVLCRFKHCCGGKLHIVIQSICSFRANPRNKIGGHRDGGYRAWRSGTRHRTESGPRTGRGSFQNPTFPACRSGALEPPRRSPAGGPASRRSC